MQREQLQYFLKRFNSFSVREESGVKLAEEELGIHAEWVLDPVFLCEMKHWNKLIQNGKQRVSKTPYVFGYVLDLTEKSRCN